MASNLQREPVNIHDWASSDIRNQCSVIMSVLLPLVQAQCALSGLKWSVSAKGHRADRGSWLGLHTSSTPAQHALES